VYPREKTNANRGIPSVVLEIASRVLFEPSYAGSIARSRNCGPIDVRMRNRRRNVYHVSTEI